ncbi:methylamine--glutamate N-methyltransferase [Malassezia vespertilionis]|uniref:tRNA (guanine(26)-N(2))-dimethyltransferase n=1 Tax=Malassezia vespertilionis TaxID=2020962 RepID=A0A2N1JEB8_9BASI|nr:methylamine--glutamate N-methyltransferase [Malassezia vespertilionis]PKI84898.1 Trm1p [Malassezia vespertilionis]WFD06012.1 methylamine--glutamate N-methyltransferase [Malassezia vespertilionis]
MAPVPVLLGADVVAARGMHIKKNETAFQENSATIVMPSKEAAFLNPVQEFNRDLSTLSIISWSKILNKEKEQRFSAHGKAHNAKCNEHAAKRAKTEEVAYRDYKFNALEALSATGLRSIRYAKEIPLLGSIVANDLSKTAVDAMRRNLALNFPPGRQLEAWSFVAVPDAKDVPSEEHESQAPTIHPDCKVHANQGDAIALMYQHRDPPKRFDMIDLDPYGSAAPFLDAAVQSVADGGLLCITCTDLAVLAGHNYPEKCWSLYGGVSVKAEYSHEVALRLVLHAIAQAAGRYGRYIQPMLSLSIDFYLRVFVRVWSRPETVKLNAAKTGLVYTCSKCSNFHIQPMGRTTHSQSATGGTHLKFGSASGPPTDMKCAECGGSFHVGGPMWFGALHDPAFCTELLQTLDSGEHKVGTEARIRGMVNTARDELDAPFYFHPAKVAGLFHCTSPALAPVVQALLNAGFQASRSHCVAGSIKTDAPRTEVHDLFRTWIRSNPVNPARIKENSAAWSLLQHRRQDGSPATRREFDFDTPHKRTEEAIKGTVSAGRMVRYQMNPQANWGPGTAAKGHQKHAPRSLAPEEIARRAQEWKQKEAEDTKT